jgi:long-chain acyl-CoA synthetase
MNPWAGYPVPPMRHEALHGDRVVRCFAGRPGFAAGDVRQSHLQAPTHDAMVFEGRRWSYDTLAPRPRAWPANWRPRACRPATGWCCC